MEMKRRFPQEREKMRIETDARCYSTPECFTVGYGRYPESDLNSNCFVWSQL